MLPGSASILFRSSISNITKCGALPGEHRVIGNYSWPGNIRELRNVMEYLVVCCAPNGHVDNSYIYGTFDLSSPECLCGI